MSTFTFIVSPFRERPPHYDQQRAREYAMAAWYHSWNLREVPFVGHLYFTQFLDDRRPKERARGMEANYAFMKAASLVAVYTDLGISEGMEQDIRIAHDLGLPNQMRTIPKWPNSLATAHSPLLFPPAVTALLRAD